MLITLLLHVALAVDPTPAVSSGLIRAAVTEAATVWAPYGVVVDTAGPFDCAHCAPCHQVDDDPTVLTVVAVERGRSAVTPGWGGPLGAIVFAPGGVPTPVITVFFTDIVRFIAGAHVLGMPQWQWPPTVREDILGRVLGRVLAHEIGHYVLRSPQHAPDGLMRSLQLAEDLVAPSRHRFALTAADAARLENRR